VSPPGLPAPAAARPARRSEVFLVDALLGAHDWTARDATAVLLTCGERLAGAATLTVHPGRRASGQFRLRFRLVEGLETSTALAAFASLVRLALETGARAGVGGLAIEGVPERPGFGAILHEHGFCPGGALSYFEGDLEAVRAATHPLAERALARDPSLALTPLTRCSPPEVFALSALSLGVAGLGVRALFTGDADTLGSFTASHGIEVCGKLRGAIVARWEGQEAFIEMLAVEPRFAARGLAVALIERCALRLLEAGARTCTFMTADHNREMMRIAAWLKCRATRRVGLWQRAIGNAPA
jgi:ribosomal protein S18 acetylase RimI-like enzyme